MATADMNVIDLAETGLSDLNQQLQTLDENSNQTQWTVTNPMGGHAIAVGLTRPLDVIVNGHVGFYCGGMNQEANIKIKGHAGPGVAENMMSGSVHVTGNASQSAGATAQGGLLVIEGDAASRCGISMKGVDIVIGGSVGHMSAFMAQSGNLVICGNAGADLGDSIYEARLFVQGEVESLGADCIEKDMRDEHKAMLRELLEKAGVDADVNKFRRYGSARKLYNFNVDHAASY